MVGIGAEERGEKETMPKIKAERRKIIWRVKGKVCSGFRRVSFHEVRPSTVKGKWQVVKVSVVYYII